MKNILIALCSILLTITSCQKEDFIDEIDQQNIFVYKYYTPEYGFEADVFTLLSFHATREIDSIFEMGTIEFNNEIYNKTFLKKTSRNGTRTSEYQFKQEIDGELIELKIDTISLPSSVTNLDELIATYEKSNPNRKYILIGFENDEYQIQLLETSTTPNIYKIKEGKTYLEDHPHNVFLENLNTQKDIETENGLTYDTCNEYFYGADDYEHRSTIYYKDDLLIQENIVTIAHGRITYRKELSDVIKIKN